MEQTGRRSGGRGCRNCGRRHAWAACPAYGKKCANCGKFNHFAKMCVNEESYSEYSEVQSEYSEVQSEYSDVQSECSETESTIASSIASSQVRAVKKPKGCFNCGFKHKPGKCPAYGKECTICHKMNHFAQVCFSNPQNQVNAEPVNYRVQNNNHTNAAPRINGMATSSSTYNVPKNAPQTNGITPYYNHPSGAVPKYYNTIQNQNTQPPQASGSKQKKKNINPAPRRNNNQATTTTHQNNNQAVSTFHEKDLSKCFLDKCTLKHDRVVKFHSCGHSFFRNCLAKAILESGQATIRCPSLQACTYLIPEAALGSILTREEYEIYKGSEQNFQCRTPGCDGWCTYRNEVMFFHCPSCSAVNCLLCKSIHSGGPCKELDDLLNYPDEKNTEALKNIKNPEAKIYPKLLDMYKMDLVLCPEPITCPICFDEFGPNEGIILKECLHKFCRNCLRHTINLSENVEVKCPFIDDNYSCPNNICEYEIKALLSNEEYEMRLDKTLSFAEKALPLTFHCKTPDCKGWCEIETDSEEFSCPICFETNCIICAVIHEGLTCEEYQQSLYNEMSDATIDLMINRGEAMKCPKCSAIITKIDGCDGMKCAFCRLDICWVTKRPRWGPNGPGDYSGGCRCNYNGVKCHPDCGNCH